MSYGVFGRETGDRDAVYPYGIVPLAGRVYKDASGFRPMSGEDLRSIASSWEVWPWEGEEEERPVQVERRRCLP